jgi:hypothetical protein
LSGFPEAYQQWEDLAHALATAVLSADANAISCT